MTTLTSKSLTYVELDLDLYRITQFDAVADGVAVPGWSKLWDADSTMVGRVDATLPNGKGARIDRTVSSDSTFWRWDAPPSLVDVSAVAWQRNTFNTAGSSLGVVLRGTGTDGAENAYLLQIVPTKVRIGKWLAGTFSELHAINLVADVSQAWWLRFDAINIAGGEVLLRGKIWQGALADEPALFTLFFEDSSSPILTAGGAGLHIFNATDDVIDVGHFRVRSLFGSLNETTRYAKPTDYLPKSIAAIPNMIEAKLSPAVVSLGKDLGQRATVSVAFKDGRHADLGELFPKGSYWGKFRARQLFRRGAALRVKRGQLTDALSAFEARHYVMEAFDGPTPAGGFSISGQDVIKLADNDRAQAPKLSNGFLNAAITNVATSATLAPSGVGNAEYPASGKVAIGGKEICSFTRVNDTLTLTRAQNGTVAIAHDAEDRVQLCVDIVAQKPSAIANLLFTTYAGVPASYITLTDWTAECDTYLQRVYTRLIAEPTGVNKLLSELAEQAGLAFWTDDIAQKIRLQVLRGIPTTAFLYSPENVLGGTIQSREQPDTRVTQVWTYYGVRNPLEPLDQPENYRSTLATVDTEGETLHGSAVIKKIFATWIPAFGSSAAQRVNDLVLGRFASPPRRFSFSVMRYSNVQEPQLGGGYRITYYGNQDEGGAAAVAPIQVVSVDPMADRFDVEAEEMLFKQFDPADLTNRVITIDSNINNVDLKVLHDQNYPPLTADDVTAGVTLTCIVNDGVIVGSASTALRAFDVGTGWPVGFDITLRVLGRIQGHGGDGGNGGPSPTNGQAGGIALYTRFAIDLEVDTGEIWGGGGGGAGTSSGPFGRTGGGGAGKEPGAAGINGSPGQPGTTEAGGASGGSGAGAGGGPGLAGANGDVRNGGAAGAAIDGISFVTVTLGPGDRRGPEIN